METSVSQTMYLTAVCSGEHESKPPMVMMFGTRICDVAYGGVSRPEATCKVPDSPKRECFEFYRERRICKGTKKQRYVNAPCVSV
jgi:hypothetical protein